MASRVRSLLFFASPLRCQNRSAATIAANDHTTKWMQRAFDKKTPMELINEVPPIPVAARIASCEGGGDPALGHPIEYICLDLPEPAICKYCGLRFVQTHHSHHH